MGTKDDLIAARALISTPAMWKKSAGEAGPGTPCCAILAVQRIRPYGTSECTLARNALRAALPGGNASSADWAGYEVGRFNDDPATTHADIMALFDRAIEAAA